MTTDITTRNTPDRMDLPFVGLTTFVRQPACPDWDRLDGAGVAVLTARASPRRSASSRPASPARSEPHVVQLP
jgi:hypothetical protein